MYVPLKNDCPTALLQLVRRPLATGTRPDHFSVESRSAAVAAQSLAAPHHVRRAAAEGVPLRPRRRFARWRGRLPAPLSLFMRDILLRLSCIGGTPPRLLYLHTS